MRRFILFLMLTVLTLGLYSQPVQVGDEIAERFETPHLLNRCSTTRVPVILPFIFQPLTWGLVITWKSPALTANFTLPIGKKVK